MDLYLIRAKSNYKIFSIIRKLLKFIVYQFYTFFYSPLYIKYPRQNTRYNF